MQRTIILETEDDAKMRWLLQCIANASVTAGAKAASFNTPLEAFAAIEGPARIEKLIDEGCMGRPGDAELLQEMGREAANRIAANLLRKAAGCPPMLDEGMLEETAIDSAIYVFEDHMDALSQHEKDIAFGFIKYCGTRAQRGRLRGRR